MNEWRYEEITTFLKKWVNEEGVCRFCARGRCCQWSRRGRQECNGYRFANEMDCFHLWIAHFDNFREFRDGYLDPDDFPWKNASPEEDIPDYPQQEEAIEIKRVKLGSLKKEKYDLMQDIDDIHSGKKMKTLSKQLDNVESEIKKLNLSH